MLTGDAVDVHYSEWCDLVPAVVPAVVTALPPCTDCVFPPRKTDIFYDADEDYVDDFGSQENKTLTGDAVDAMMALGGCAGVR